MKVVIGLLLLVAVACAVEVYTHEKEDFSLWVAKNNKVYGSPKEYQHRYNIWKDNVQKANKHNAEGHSWTQGPTVFADLTPAEFADKYLMKVNWTAMPVPAAYPQNQMAPTVSSVDWSSKGCVSPVKNQGQCGSCWAFAAVGAIESAWCIAGHGITDLSEQQIVDCTKGTGNNNACNGGLPMYAYKWMMTSNNKGITTESNYPYAAIYNQYCKSTDTSGAKITSYSPDADGYWPTNEAQLQSMLQSGPVTVGITYAENLFTYTGGIWSNCADNYYLHINHAVLVTAMNSQYYTVKNSWGPNWGENGFFRVSAGTGGDFPYSGTCGIGNMADMPYAS